MLLSLLFALFLFLPLRVPAGAAAAAPRRAVELYLIPHTHADVGWLQTLDSLSRVNVSRILDGVVGNLLNDTQKRRRFVWDEMAFLQLWWDHQATAAQQGAFTAMVHDGRIELTDNGWSQHDMGCTTVDSMLNNWVGTCKIYNLHGG
jgi:lysosomal alpha-mannosidase